MKRERKGHYEGLLTFFLNYLSILKKEHEHEILTNSFIVDKNR